MEVKYRCFRNINKQTIVPNIKVGLGDFMYILFALFITFILFLILSIFSLPVALGVALFLLIIIGVVLLKVRKVYYKTGRLDILTTYLDYLLEDKVLKGRGR